MKHLEVSEYLTASAMRAAGATLLDVRPNGGGRCAMRFDDTTGEASRLMAEHRAGRLQVSSREMADSIQAVKNEIFAARDGRR